MTPRRQTRLGRTRTAAANLFVALVIVTTGAMVAAGPASAGTIVGVGSAARAARCDPTQGWAAASGRPSSLQRLGAAGVYIWNERGVWRVAATHADRDLRTFQGTISFDTAMSSRPVGIDGRFDLVVPNANSASFTFKNIGGIDSILATSFCASTVTVTGTLDGQPLTPAQIFIGAGAVNPAGSPAILTKGAAPAPATTVAASTPSTAVAPLPTTAPGAAVGTCPATPWPPGTAGRPANLRPKLAAGLFAWSEKTGWTVLVSGDPGRPQLFSGRVTMVVPAPSGGVAVQPIGLEGRTDSVRVEGNTVVFSLRIGNGFDGFQLFAPCATSVTIEGTLDGVPLTAAQVFIGASAISPSSLPFTVTR